MLGQIQHLVFLGAVQQRALRKPFEILGCLSSESTQAKGR